MGAVSERLRPIEFRRIAYQVAVVPEHHITDPLTPLFNHRWILSARMTV
jgi:hypothetical protein